MYASCNQSVYIFLFVWYNENIGEIFMLKISGPGWANVIIDGKVVFDGSYLTDMPIDFMKALYDYFNNYDKEDKRFSSSVYVLSIKHQNWLGNSSI